MITGPSHFLDKTRWHWTARLRGNAGDLLYVAAIVLTMLSIDEIRVLTDDDLGFSLADRLRFASAQFVPLVKMWGSAALILTIAVLNAPRQGPYRWLTMIVGAGVALLSVNRYFVLVEGAHPSFDHIARGTITTLLIAAGFFFHNTARREESELFHTQIAAAGREAEFQRAQLELLRAQIEPHFLFNTLATVRTLAQTAPAAAADMIGNVMRYFAGALPKFRQNESTLAEEFDLIDAYLRIQQVRLGDRLSYHFSVPEELLAVPVPPVMLLTLVENAIKHGISPANAGGSVHVSVDQRDSVLTLRVTDTGQGMQAQHGKGTGLANVRARLALLYRHRAKLTLTEGEPSGVVATIQIPVGDAA